MPQAVEVLVVAYGASDLLDRCLAALGGALPVTVVDNSSEGAVSAVTSRHGATYVDAGSNLGFAGGVNLGLRRRSQTRSDVLLLNPDATIAPRDVTELHTLLHTRPDLAAVAPSQVDPSDGNQARVAWPFPTPWGAWIEAVGLGGLRRRHGFLIGSVLLLRAAALDEVGPFDERFFLYAEETDWQKRASDLGWRVALCPSVTATHVGAGTGGDTTEREAHFHASLERYMRKHYGTTGWWLFRTGVLAGSLLRALLVPGERGRRAAARFRLYRVGPCRAEERSRAAGRP
jgi:GT2 family glycosyltransferase